MSQDKKSKIDDIEKLRKLLDNVTFENLDSEDEKHLIALKKRLSKPEHTITFTQQIKSDEADPMKPKVLVHLRKEQKLTIIKEESDKKTEIEYTKKMEGFIDEDIFEIEKVKVEGPEFIEVKPKDTSKEDEVTIPHEDKQVLAEEELREWEPVEVEKKEKIIDKTKKEIKETNFCINCGTSLKDVRNFCPKCGEKLNFDYKKKIEQSTISTISVDEIDEKSVDIKPIITSEKEVVEVTEGQIVTDEKLISDYEKIKVFKDMNSINEKTAIILYNSGYTSFNHLQEATFKDLRKIKRLKRKIAKNIIKELNDKIQEKFEVKPISIDESSEGEIMDKDIQTEPEKTDEKTGKASPVELHTTTAEWIPVEEEKTLKPVDEEIQKPTEEELEELNKKIETFKEIESIDDKTAVILYDNGYNSIDLLSIASVKDLSKIKGIKKKNAKQIKKEIKEKTEWKTPIIVEEKTKENEFIVDEKINVFIDLQSVDEQIAILLYDNGYTSIESLNDVKVKDLSKIKGLKKKVAKNIIEEIKEKSKDLELIEEDDKKIEHGFVAEEAIDDIQVLEIGEEQKNPFEKIDSINDKIYKILMEYSINSLTELDNLTIKDLTKMKGIRKKIAKKIKQEVKMELEKTQEPVVEKYYYDEDTYEKEENLEEDEWESFDEEEISDVKVSEVKGFRHGEYNLYEKEIELKDGNKRTVRFFSKEEPENSKLIMLPRGYEVKENKKTGVPYLRKKK
jgi:Holliday junction resolvasome RuvABC DNA-binding subunit